MDQSNSPQNRKTRRSNVLMSASLELSGASLPVRLRNLSAEGALVEGEKLPVEGAALQFRKGELVIPGRIAWVKGRNAGIAFAKNLDPEQVMRHVPTPRARVKLDFRRPGLRTTVLSQEEQLASEHLVWAGPINLGD